MIRNATIYFSVLIFLTMVIFFLKKESPYKSQFLVVCTTTIIADVVKNIGGTQVTVKTLMGPGVDPHLYRARESDVAALSSANLIFYNGLHLEGKMGDIFAHMHRYAQTIAVAEAIPKEQCISSDFAGIYDPHVWHDVSLWRHIIPVIEQALSAHDPNNTAYYHAQAVNYDKKLAMLDLWIKEQIATIPSQQRILVTAHDAFSYFGRAYGIYVIGLQGISTDAQVSAQDIQVTVDYIVRHQIVALFLESSIPARSIQAVQQAVQARGWHVSIAPELFSDSLGDQSTTAHSYCDMMQYNVKTIISALTQ